LRGKSNAIRKPELQLDPQLVQQRTLRSYPRSTLWAQPCTRPVPHERAL